VFGCYLRCNDDLRVSLTVVLKQKSTNIVKTRSQLQSQGRGTPICKSQRHSSFRLIRGQYKIKDSGLTYGFQEETPASFCYGSIFLVALGKKTKKALLFPVLGLISARVRSTSAGGIPKQGLVIRPSVLVPLTGQVNLEPRPNCSPFGIKFNFSDERPHSFSYGSPPRSQQVTALLLTVHCRIYLRPTLIWLNTAHWQLLLHCSSKC